jgi:maltooligosyltrehalose trehalohydrolase
VTTFTVWAPRPERVELDLRGSSIPMQRTGGGWWAVDADAGPGDRYGFRLDGGAPRPDPRSRRQPDGVPGPSALVDLADHGWRDAGFRAPPVGSWIIYELHVGTFTRQGTFDAAAERLDHLVGLGVTTIEVMPVAAFPGRHGWGYDGVQLWATHEPYGGPLAFQRFVDAAHERGLAVVLDVVHNHLGPLGNHLSEFGPYFTDEVHTPWGEAVNLDGAGSDEVRAHLTGSACAWLRDFHLDGLRLDAVHALHDTSAHPFLAELAGEVRALEAQVERPLVLIAESDRNDPRLFEPPEAGGMGLHGAWADELHHSIHVAVTGERLGYYEDHRGTPGELAEVLAHGYLYRGERSAHRGRRHGRALHPETPLDRLVVASQNHDQVGNRALGERLEHLSGVAQARLAAAVVLLAPAVPLLFQGEEWAATTPFQYFTDHPDPELAEAVRTGRRAEFSAFDWAPEQVPDPQDPGTRLRSCLMWDELDDGHHAAMLAWYRDLIRVRRTVPELRDPRQHRVRTRAHDGEGWMVVERSGVAVVVTLGGDGTRVRVPVPGCGELILATEGAGVAAGGDAVEMPPWGVALVRRAAEGATFRT